MSETREQIIDRIKEDPENAADAFIQLQKEFTVLQQNMATLNQCDTPYDLWDTLGAMKQ